MGQLREILDKCLNPTFLRYSHFDGSTHFVDLGGFGDKNYNIYVTRENLTKEPKVKQTSTVPTKSITPVSGVSGDTIVDLSIAIAAQPSLATDADYPIQGNRVVNNTIIKGVHLQEPMSTHKTKNDGTPSQAQKEQVALSTYGQCVRILQQSNPRTVIDVEMMLETPPLINSLLFTNLVKTEQGVDALTQQQFSVTTLNINQWMRVVSVQSSLDTTAHIGDEINRNRATLYKIQLTSGSEVEDFNESKYIFDTLQKAEDKDIQGAISAIAIHTVSVTHNAVASDCSSGWGNGKTYSFTPPVESATRVNYTVDVPANRSYVVTQVPVIGVSPLTICVSGENNDDWDTSDNLQIRARFVYT